MSIRVIDAHLNGTPQDEKVLASALALAQRFGGHVYATYALPSPGLTPPPTGLGLFPGVYKALAASAKGEWQERADKAETRFKAWCAKNKLMQSDGPDRFAPPTIEWREAGKHESLALASPLADLLVTVPPPLTDETAFQLGFELPLLREGRPVLFVPKGVAATRYETPLIGWNGSPEAFHAVQAALPILQKATTVHVCTVAEKNFTEGLAEKLIAYLAWHGIRAVAAKPAKGAGAEDALEATARRVGADLLVMGAYTHGRLRQLVFGGMTRRILNRGKIPTLMAH